jgi:geranylgeranyl reductase family protein
VHTADVLVVGGGPSGAAAADLLAEAGHDVVLVERKHYPREKTCGDGLTPRAVKQLNDMGLADALTKHHRYDGLRSIAFGHTLEMRWPEHPEFPNYGYVVTRHDLDALVAQNAEKSGATVWDQTEATAPIIESGLVRGAVLKRKETGAVEEIRARYVIVADGSLSRFGRAIGASRNKAYPQGMAIRGYFSSDKHDTPWIESHLDIRDSMGNVLPGYGWIFPVGDGRINVGIGLLSTFHQWKAINTTHLQNEFVSYLQRTSDWGVSPETSLGAPTGGRLPMAFSVGPQAGPTWLITGDAGGAINPFNGEGISYAYETGRLAADVLNEALVTGNGLALTEYDRRLQETYALYYKVARAFVHIIGRPELMRLMVGTGIRSQTLMEWVLKIMANLLNPDELGPAEAAYKAVAAIARMAPAA